MESIGAKVWILKQVPLQKFSPQRAIVRSLLFGLDLPKGVTFTEHSTRQQSANRIIDSVAARKKGVRVIDLSESFFDSNGYSQIGDANGSYYRDENHVSTLGGRVLIRPALESMFDELAANHTDETPTYDAHE